MTAYDAGVPGGALFLDGGFTTTGLLGTDAGIVATATSTYSGYPASAVLDFDLDTSWYIDSLCSATSGDYCCDGESIRLDLPSARTVTAIVLLGNAGSYPDGYDLLTARLELLNAGGVVVATRDVVFSRPAGDWATIFSPAIAGVRAVRLRAGFAEASAPGLSEVQLFVQ